MLRPVLNSLNDLLSQDIGFVENVPDCLDRLYYDIVNILVTCAKNFVPVRHKCFYKFWWDEELDTLKEAALSLTSYGKLLASLDLVHYLTIDNVPISCIVKGLGTVKGQKT